MPSSSLVAQLKTQHDTPRVCCVFAPDNEKAGYTPTEEHRALRGRCLNAEGLLWFSIVLRTVTSGETLALHFHTSHTPYTLCRDAAAATELVRCAKDSSINQSSSFTMHIVIGSFSSPVRSVCAVAIVLCLCTTAFASSYAEVQFLGLEALYNSTNGQEWKTSTGWRDSLIDVCNWYGVACDSDSGNVTGLSLSSNGLVGDVSEAIELSNVSSLKELGLSDNQLSGPVPLMLGLMPHLEYLDLSENELSFFPASWGSGASRLRHMSLQNNRISG